MLEVEILGAHDASELPGPAELEGLCIAAAASRGVEHGHVAIELVDARRISELNLEHRRKSGPTDVLSFPIDGVEHASAPAVGHPPAAIPPCELGDIVICPEHTVDLREAVVHGMLHLLGMDHETDSGEMLALQDELMMSHDS